MVAVPPLPAPAVGLRASRRRVLRIGFWTGAGLTVLTAGLALDRFLRTAGPAIPGAVRLAAGQVPRVGAPPVYVPDARGYLVNLRPGEGGFDGREGNRQGGLVALYQACTHLGCRLPWRPEYDFEGARGWFRCPCHSATYTKAGVCVFGPAARNMDTLDLIQAQDGSVLVRKNPIHRGNPRP